MNIVDSILLNTRSESSEQEFGIFINGKMKAGKGPIIGSLSRIDGSITGQIFSAGEVDVAEGYTSALKAQSSWNNLTSASRAEIFQNAAKLFRERSVQIGEMISKEMGKPALEAKTEVEKGASILDYYAQTHYRSIGDFYTTDTGEDVFVVEEPLGTVLLITPWNFPFTLPMRKIAAALAVGNTAIFKPATNSSITALLIGMTFKDAGLPDGVLNVIIGRSSLIEHSLFDNSVLSGVSLTGSYDTASKIRGLIPVEIPFQAELGGKNALVIWKDADQKKAMEIVKASSFRNNGQICTSCGRLLVHSDIAVEFLTMIREYIAEVKSDSPDGKLGILSSEFERDKITETLVRGKGQYKELIKAPWGSDLFGPTVVVEPQSSELLNEEIFGPVITYEVIDNLEDALEKLNRTSYGLTAGIVTQDLTVAQKFWKSANAGTIKINTSLTGTPFHVPLEGWGRSGVGGGEGGKSSIEFFTRRKAVYIKR